MKKFMTMLLTVLIVATSLTGCSGGKNSKNVQTNTKDGKTLTVWCWDPNFCIYTMKEAEKIYQKENPDFKINFVEIFSNDIETKLATAATTNNLDTLPDILLLQDNSFKKNYSFYPQVFEDLTDSGINFNNFPQSKKSYSLIDGKNYGVPFDTGASVFCVRTDILKQAGYKVEDLKDISWSKFIEIGKNVLKATGKPMLSDMDFAPDLALQMLQSSGGSLFDEKGLPNLEKNDKLKKVINIYKELITSGIMVPVNAWDQYIGTLVNGTVAGTINGCWIVASIESAKDQSGKWALTTIPKLDNVDGATNYSNNGGSTWVVTKSGKNKKLAADFMTKTLGSSVELYETVLSKGVVGTYIPAGESKAYNVEDAFFGGQKIYSDISSYMSKVPSTPSGAYYYEARDAVAVVVKNVIAGANVDSELKAAQDTVLFQTKK